MKLTLINQGREITREVAPGSNLLDEIRKASLPLAAPCGGRGICNKCRVNVLGEGTLPACDYTIDHPVTVSVGDLPPMQILSESYFPDWTHMAGRSKSGREGIGVAVDLGTTTVVVFLEDLATGKNLGVRSFVNPQQAFGADVISRILYTQQNPGGLEMLRKVVSEPIEEAVLDLCQRHKTNSTSLGPMVITGNTTMLHIFRGTDPVPLSVYPFTPLFIEEVKLNPSEAGFNRISPEAVILMPGISAYVGADIAAGLAAIDWPEPGTYDLYLDIGTNGEMALIGHDRILTCATAAGPAFEGARISCGMGGVSGAVSALGMHRFETIDNLPPAGLCGSGLVDAVAMLLEEGLIDPSGYAEKDLVLMTENLHGRHPALSLTPQDIREVQLAKAAIAAGIRILREDPGHNLSVQGHVEVNRLWLAGGFGYALHPQSAGRIGLIPKDLVERTIQVGNMAGLGARFLLHDPLYRERLMEVQRKTEYLELSQVETFNDLFVMSMGFEE